MSRTNRGPKPGVHIAPTPIEAQPAAPAAPPTLAGDAPSREVLTGDTSLDELLEAILGSDARERDDRGPLLQVVEAQVLEIREELGILEPPPPPPPAPPKPLTVAAAADPVAAAQRQQQEEFVPIFRTYPPQAQRLTQRIGGGLLWSGVAQARTAAGRGTAALKQRPRAALALAAAALVVVAVFARGQSSDVSQARVTAPLVASPAPAATPVMAPAAIEPSTAPVVSAPVPAAVPVPVATAGRVEPVTSPAVPASASLPPSPSRPSGPRAARDTATRSTPARTTPPVAGPVPVSGSPVSAVTTLAPPPVPPSVAPVVTAQAPSPVRSSEPAPEAVAQPTPAPVALPAPAASATPGRVAVEAVASADVIEPAPSAGAPPVAGSNAGTTPPAPVGANAGVTRPARLVSQVWPKYPELATRAGTKGVVEVEVFIDTEGRVTRAAAVSGPMTLRNAATSAVLQWRYEPASVNGTPVGSGRRVRVAFE